MYIPAFNRVADFDKLTQFMREHSFATLVTLADGTPYATHLPLLLDTERGPQGTLSGHLARGNEQWQHFAAGQTTLVIFQGPHAYISPSWYEAEVAVPTWNYVAVHAYGIPKIINEQADLEALLKRQIATYEANFAQPWPGDLPPDYANKMMQAIVGFEIPISQLEGKWKLGQNRSPADVQKVYNTLSASPTPDDQQLAATMREELAVLPSPND